ncbi:MAG: hypothetical protein AAF236_17605 [Verrucomicrobiota bacterium]
MSTVTEIEKAIEMLDPGEVDRVAEWLQAHRRRIAENREGAKREAILATAGSLSGEEGADFAKAVEDAGSGVGS